MGVAPLLRAAVGDGGRVDGKQLAAAKMGLAAHVYSARRLDRRTRSVTVLLLLVSGREFDVCGELLFQKPTRIRRAGENGTPLYLFW